jgi:hypothetical protein
MGNDEKFIVIWVGASGSDEASVGVYVVGAYIWGLRWMVLLVA